jgi:hypothetical protein
MGAALGVPGCLEGVEYVGPDEIRKFLVYFCSKVDNQGRHAYM